MILNRYERAIAKRYLLPIKGEGFIFVVAAFSVGAVALGVAALIIVMSVMNGFRAELFDKIVGLNGHAIVQGYEGRLPDWQRIADSARKLPGVTSATPMIAQPLMASANGRVEGVVVRGMRIEDIRGNSVMAENMKSGSLADDHIRKRPRSHWFAPRRDARRLSWNADQPDQPGRPVHGRRHGSSNRVVHRRRSLRGRRVRL